MSITVDRQDEEKVWLKIEVTDTGYGIKPEDQGKLFSDFVQVDIRKNRSIEGTGLGLAISRQLCLAMGGDISFQSEYGKGSSFTAIIPQDIDSPLPLASVEEPEKKKVLVCEEGSYAKSLCWSLDNLRVPYALVTDIDEFALDLNRDEWFFVFADNCLYKKIKPVMDSAVFFNKKRPSLALMAEWGTETYIPNAYFVSLPIQSLSIANLLNGKAERQDNSMNTASSSPIRFRFPGARLLVVDDIATNLKVAEGLIAPYGATVDSCLSGEKALELVKRNKYDLIFMDHMMPEMDGIEATAAIRAWEMEQTQTAQQTTAAKQTTAAQQTTAAKQTTAAQQTRIPVIALTANAVSGMREMFIEKGLSDFLAKPIDVAKLDETLNRWIPKEKREQKMNEEMKQEQTAQNNGSAAAGIPGVDIQRGIRMTGGSMEVYREVLDLFCTDVDARLPILKNVPDAASLVKFATQAHALKSASGSIGAAEVSALAAKLEAAGKAGNIALVEENLGSFASQLEELVKGIRNWLNSAETQDLQEGGNNASLLRELVSALEAEKAGDIDRILEELMRLPHEAKMKESLEKVSDDVLMTEFRSAAETVRSLIT
jgi:CheY-like chemotaxis protein